MTASSETYTLRVLHLSDLHERVSFKMAGPARERKVRAHKAKQARVLGDELMEQLDKIVAAGAPDLLFFTGDLADWGLDGEYDLAETRLGEIVARVGLTWAQVFFVPGNHDVNRNKEAQHFTQLRRFAAENPDKIGAVMAGFANYLGAPEETLSVVAARQAGHHELLRRIERESLIPGPERAHPCLGYRQQVQVRDLPFPVHVIGLDTAWLAGGDDDAGKLRLTDEQIDAHTRDDDGQLLKGLRVALMHHPLADLADHMQARRRLASTVDLVTHGHQHVPSFIEIVDPDRRLAVLAAGCLYEGDAGDRWTNRFHVLNVETNDQGQPLRYQVEFFKWSTDGDFWREDTDLYKNARDGCLIWDTHLGQSQPPTVSATPLPAAALAKFVGRAQQLADLAAALLPPSGQAQASMVCNVQGMAGVGKSFLVARFFDEHRASFPGGHVKITLGSAERPTVDSLLQKIADHVGLKLAPGELAAGLRMKFEDKPPLLQIDNLDTDQQTEAAARLEPLLPHTPLVLSGRCAFGAERMGWPVVVVAPFEEGEAQQQLDRELGEVGAKGEPNADKQALVKALGGLPLAISLAGGYLRGGRSIKNFLKKHRERLLTMKADRAPSTIYLDQSRDELLSLGATFELSIEALREKLGEQAEAGMPAVCTLGVAPLVGVRIGWLSAIMGVDEVQAEDWLAEALTLSIVQLDSETKRWRVHKLLAEHLKQHTDVEAAIARMDEWVMERLPKTPEETRGARWAALNTQHNAVAEWVAGLDGERAARGAMQGFEYAFVNGPYTAWLDTTKRGLEVTQDAQVRFTLLWAQVYLAPRAGILTREISADAPLVGSGTAQELGQQVAPANALRKQVGHSWGEPDSALNSRWDGVPVVAEQRGALVGKMLLMSELAATFERQGHIGEALRIWRHDVLPIVMRLEEEENLAVTMGKIADLLGAQGHFDEALRIYWEEVLPIFKRHNCLEDSAITMGKIANI